MTMLNIDFFRQNRKSLIFIYIIYLCIAFGLLTYKHFMPGLIEAMYSGESIGFLNNIIEGQATHTLAYYLEHARKSFLNIIFFNIYSSFIFLFIVLSLNKIGKNKNSYKYLFFTIMLSAIIMRCVYDFAQCDLISSVIQPKNYRLSHNRWKNMEIQYHGRMSFIKNTTSEDSMIIFPPFIEDRWSIFHDMGELNLCGYFIFPRLAVYENDTKIGFYDGPVYRIDVEGFTYAGKYERRYALDKDFSLLLLKERAKEGKLHLNDFTDIQTGLFNAMLALLKLVLMFIAGAYVVDRYFTNSTRLSFFVTSFLVGTIVSGIIYIFLNFMGINFSESLQFSLLGVLSSAGLISMIRRTKFTWRVKELSLSCKAAFVLVGLFFFLLFVKGIYTPIMASFDATAIWGFKAKAVFGLHNIIGLGLWGAHREYPPLLPILMSQMAIGGEMMVKVLFPLFALCLYGNIYDEIRRTRFPPALKIIFPILIFSAPSFFMRSYLAESDFALAVFVTLAVTIASKLSKHSTGKEWFSLAIVLCGVILIRPTGSLYLFIVALVALLLSRLKQYRLHNLLYILLPAACFLLWTFYYTAILKVRPFFCLEMSKGIMGQFNWSHLVRASGHFTTFLIDPKYDGIIPALFILLCIFRWRSIIKNYPFEGLFIVIALILRYVFCFLFFEHTWNAWSYLISHTADDGFARYFMPVIPIMLIIILKEIDLLTRDIFTFYKDATKSS